MQLTGKSAPRSGGRRRRTRVLGAATAALACAVIAAPTTAVAATSPGQLAGAPLTRTVKYLLKHLTVDEKLQLVHGGTDPNPHGEAGIILGVPRLGIPDFREADAQGINVYADATAYPGRIGLAASFDRTGLGEFGQAVGTEGRALDVDLVYGPQVDLARFPTWGRNMTTYGEDPYLAGQLTGSEINAIQSTGLLSQVKHFSFYDGQNQNLPSIVTDESAHELYLAAPEAAVKDAGVSSVMCSYATFQITPVENQPDYACSNAGALNGILKGQWGFTGWVTSDYGGSKNVSDLLAGMDQEFATGNLLPANLKPLVDPTSASYSATYAAALDLAVGRILYQYQRFGLLDDSSYPTAAKTGVKPIKPAPAAVDKQSGINLARTLAEQTGVLLKNDRGTLPLTTAETQKIAVVGPTADLMPAAPGGERSRGFGDRNIISPLKAMQQQSGGAVVNYAPGIDRIGTQVPSTALLTSNAAGATTGLTRTETDADGNVVSTGVDTTFDGRQTGLVRGHVYTWTGYVNVPTTDTYSLWLQRSVGTFSGDASQYNHGVNPGLQQGGRTGAAPTAALSIDGVAQTLTAPSTILPNTYPGGQTVNGQYLGLDNSGADVPLTAGLHPITLTYRPAVNTAPTPVFRFGWAPQNQNVANAVAAAQGSNVAVVFVDDANTTTTAGDVGTLGPNEDALIQAVSAANPNTVVVLNSNGAVKMPWLNSVRSVLEMWYPGQEGGTATANLLFGRANPSGKLPITFPGTINATPFGGHPERSVGTGSQIVWSENLDIGYRWNVDNGVAPQFPFGFGLSYSSFSYSGMTAKPAADGGVDVKVKVTNTGKRAGSDVPQVYVGKAAGMPSDVTQTATKLVQFQRVTLAAKTSTTVTMHVAPRQLSSWSTSQQAWVLGTGSRVFHVQSSSTPGGLTARVQVKAPAPAR
ncbi:beta-glucosidase [Jatrophihabitans sp. YIM 134969]